MVRTPGYDKFGLKKGTWTPEEDKKLTAYVTKHGYWNWRKLPKYAGLARCGKSCRLRWMNYLRPGVKRGNYTKEEEDTIIRLHHKLGNRWSVIAAQLPGRSDNEVKNHWHSSLKKRLTQNMTSTETNGNGNDGCTESNSNEEGQVAETNNMHCKINEGTSDTAMSCSPQQGYFETWDSFWTDPFISETSLMLNGDFTDYFDGEVLYGYDDLFSSL